MMKRSFFFSVSLTSIKNRTDMVFFNVLILPHVLSLIQNYSLITISSIRDYTSFVRNHNENLNLSSQLHTPQHLASSLHLSSQSSHIKRRVCISVSSPAPSTMFSTWWMTINVCHLELNSKEHVIFWHQERHECNCAYQIVDNIHLMCSVGHP